VDDEKPPEGVKAQVVCRAPMLRESPPIAFRHDPKRTDYRQPVQGVDNFSGKFPLIATGTREVAGAGADQKADVRVIVSGDTDIFSDAVAGEIRQNLDLARGLVQWGLRREGLVAVSARTIDDLVVTPTDRQQRLAFWWPLGVAFLPLVAGGAVWWSRRR
jgi:hypothetical protein